MSTQSALKLCRCSFTFSGVNVTMPRTIKSFLEVGLNFIEYLGERRSKTNKSELKTIYNTEFRCRDGIKNPNFSNVVFALVAYNRAIAKQGKIYLTLKERFTYGDQWQKPRRKQKSTAGPVEKKGPSAPPTGAMPPAFTSSQAQAEPEPGSRALKKRVKEIIKSLREKRLDFTSDKQGIVITSDHEMVKGKIKFNIQLIEETYVVKFYIQNMEASPIYFTMYTFLCRMCCFSLVDDKKVTPACPLLLASGDQYKVEVHFRSAHFGFFPATLAFEFRLQLNSRPFYIVRDIEAMARTHLLKELGPIAPYMPYQVAIQRPIDVIVDEGEPPESSVVQELKTVVKLGNYKYPPYLKVLAKERFEDSAFLSPTAREQLPSLKALLDSPLKIQNYAKRFKLLLHLEELQMEVDIKRYDLHNKVLNRDRSNQRLLSLEVAGVAENRPSVLRGDYLMISKVEDKSQLITMYKGYVHRVELENVKLGFSKKFRQSFIDNLKFNVQFSLNRFPLKLQHRAVELACQHQLGDVLFPTGSRAAVTAMPNLSLFDRKLEQNPEQYAAVQSIVSGVSRPAPYLVFGPPGTGKTVTVVEAIKQVQKCNPSTRILACAPSNSASDLLCERVREHMDAHSVYRLCAGSRDPRTVPSSLLECCNLNESKDCFIFPSKENLMQYKIMIATVVTAGRLVSGGFPPGHFTHIFVDEAGHAVEPECIISVAGLLHPEEGHLVLAGDPMQLGPMLRSPLAINYGLGLSLLERLMRENPLYQKAGESDQYNNSFVTKLLRNYRSHSAILKIPNELFYDGELQPFADVVLRDSYCAWEHLPKRGFPVIFHGVMGKDEREANSPSFFNVTEIQVLIDYLRKLFETRGKKGLATIKPKDIGIIAPYRKQVEKIRKAISIVDELRSLKDVKDLKVGSVEEFQGQERKVIMVSAVRSSSTYVKMDHDFNLGFLTNAKRFNVAITRAKALLIVVGNPVILNKDRTWKRFIQFCSEQGGYTGFDYADTEGEEEVMTRLAALNIEAEQESSLPGACDTQQSRDIGIECHPETVD